jgi:hypothetical protein
MSDKWVNRIVFWLLCAIPWASLMMMLKFKMLDSTWFVIGFFLYLFYYLPFVHINRLMQLRAIEEKDAWKLFIPFYSSRYMKTLWLG